MNQPMTAALNAYGNGPYGASMIAMHVRIDATVPKQPLDAAQECCVIYGAYDEGADRLPVDNLDEVAYVGKAILVVGSIFGDEDFLPYQSEIMENPTNLQLMLCVNAAVALELLKRGSGARVRPRIYSGYNEVRREGDIATLEASWRRGRQRARKPVERGHTA